MALFFCFFSHCCSLDSQSTTLYTTHLLTHYSLHYTLTVSPHTLLTHSISISIADRFSSIPLVVVSVSE
jgi:hypothetical protein